MPTIESITVQYSRKVQLEQFEPIQHSAELVVNLQDGDDPDDVYDEYADVVEDMAERQLAARVTAKKLEDDEDDE